MIYGYVRISTAKQKPERQQNNILSKYPDAHIVEEIFTGTKFYGRKKLDKLLRKVKPGDTIVFDEVSRMSRNADEGVQLYKDLYAQNINLVFLKEPQIDTDVYRQTLQRSIKVNVNTGDAETDTLVMKIIGALNDYSIALAEKQIRIAFEQAQTEVDYLHHRTSEGIRHAQAAGKHVGRNAGSTVETKKAKQVKPQILTYSKAFGGPLSDKDVIKIVGVQPNTYYKYKKQLTQARLEQENGMKIDKL